MVVGGELLHSNNGHAQAGIQHSHDVYFMHLFFSTVIKQEWQRVHIGYKCLLEMWAQQKRAK